MEGDAAGTQQPQRAAMDAVDGVRRHMLQHAVGKHDIDRAFVQPGIGGIGGRAVIDDAFAEFRRVARIGGRLQVPVAPLHVRGVRIAERRDPRQFLAQHADAQAHQLRLQQPVQIAGVHPRRAAEIAGQR